MRIHNMKLEIFSGLVLSVLLTSCFATAAIAQTSASPIPYGGSHPFERYQPIPPDPPNPNAPTEERLPNGYTPQQMEWLKANPNIRIYPDGTIDETEINIISQDRTIKLSSTAVRGMMTKIANE